MNSTSPERKATGDLPLVSVITPTYNGARYIAETIESALAQDYPNLEFIVADDGSTDNTLEIIGRYRDRVKVLALPHHGENATRNAAIAASHGAYVAFLDHDDLWLPGKISKQMRAFAENPLAGLCHSGYQFLREEGLGWISIHKDPSKYHGRCFETIFRGNGVGALTAVIRRDALPPHLFYEDIQITADYALWLDVLFYHDAIYLPEVLALHRRHPDQITHGRRERWRIYEAVSRMRLLARVRDELPEDKYSELRQWTLETLDWVTRERRESGDHGWAALGFHLLHRYGYAVPWNLRFRAALRGWWSRLTPAGMSERRFLQRPA